MVTWISRRVTAKTRRQPVFFLPCMVEVIGGVNSPNYKELVELIQVGLFALRQEAPLLMWTLKSLTGFFQFSPEMVSIIIRMLLLLSQISMFDCVGGNGCEHDERNLDVGFGKYL